MRIFMCIVALAATSTLFSQTLTNPPAFEVASVKPWDPPGGRGEINGFYTYPGGRIVCNGCTLEYLIMEAFDVQSFQIAAGPGWMKIDRFAIEARPPASSKSSKSSPALAKLPPNDEQRQMVQTLLADRFQLKFRHETKEGSVYALSKGSKALKLQAPKDQNAYPWAGGLGGGLPSGDGLAGTNISMPQLAKRMSDWLGRPVLDETGLTGSFDFKFEYPSDDPHPDVISSIITSFQGLGLKLESSKGPVETIVIDHAEKPSEN
jgi:uncharacterized protein (TIGR03435 family)